MKEKDLINKNYEVIRKPNDNHLYVRLFCSNCNKEMIVRSDYIDKKLPLCTSCQKRGNTYNLKHGSYKDRLYKIWLGLPYRRYSTYIPKVCDEWKNDFLAFKKWALSHGYNDTLTIDRMDNKKDYEPSNCRWISLSENARRARQIYSYEEKLKIYMMRRDQKLSQIEMANLLGVSRNTIQRLEKEIKNGCK